MKLDIVFDDKLNDDRCAGRMSVSLSFAKLTDFEPEAVARQVPEFAKLGTARGAGGPQGRWATCPRSARRSKACSRTRVRSKDSFGTDGPLGIGDHRRLRSASPPLGRSLLSPAPNTTTGCTGLPMSALNSPPCERFTSIWPRGSLLDQIIARPSSGRATTDYDIARRGVAAFIAELMQQSKDEKVNTRSSTK